MVQFIGGEPTLHPSFTELLCHATDVGWLSRSTPTSPTSKTPGGTLFACPGVSLATSYSDQPDEHDAITGRPGSHARTLANIRQAIARQIPLRAGIITIRDGQRSTQARAELEDIGVTRIRTDQLRHLGRASATTQPSSAELCGNCGHGIGLAAATTASCPSWLTALRPGGRLVFCLTGGSVLVTAGKDPDGGASGKVEEYHAAFMTARRRPDDPPRSDELPDHIRHGDGDHITTSPYPIVDPTWGWELDSMLSVTTPGITHHSDTDPATGITTTWMTHDDGSWARATGLGDLPAVVHQGGPRRLWDILDDIRRHWLTNGVLPLRGARVRITPTAPAT